MTTQSFRFSLDESHYIEIPKSFGRYEYIRTIGSGSFSVVVLVLDIQSKKYYACKIVSRDYLVEYGMLARFDQEIRVLQVLKHPNIVRIENIVYSEKLIFVIMEYCNNGELFRHIVVNGCLRDPELRLMFREIVEGLQYIHNHNIAHRDLKPENILLDKHNHPKLADFGLCHRTSNQLLLKTPCGSPFYAAPEIISNEEYDGQKADIWSLGVVLFTMTTGTLPWTEVNQAALFQQIKNADIVIPTEIPRFYQDLLFSMLNKNPALRPSCSELLGYRWLNVNSNPNLRISTHSSVYTKLPPIGVSKKLGKGQSTHSAIVKSSPFQTSTFFQIQEEKKDQNQPKMLPIEDLIRKIPSVGRRPQLKL